MATKTAVTPAKSGSVVSWEQALSRAAEKQKQGIASLGGGSNWLSFRGGQLTVDGAAMPNSRANVIVFAYMEERAYYEGDYDPDNPSSPICYAYGPVDGGATIAPHEKSKQPQSDKCKGCKHSEFGTAERGKGQACKQSVRLALAPLSSKVTGAEFAKQPMAFARVPPTSIKNVKGWLSQFAAEDRPTFAGVTEIEVKPDAKTQFQVKLSKMSDTIAKDLQGPIVSRIDEAHREIVQPYPDFEEDAGASKGKAKKTTAKRRF